MSLRALATYLCPLLRPYSGEGSKDVDDVGHVRSAASESSVSSSAGACVSEEPGAESGCRAEEGGGYRGGAPRVMSRRCLGRVWARDV